MSQYELCIERLRQAAVPETAHILKAACTELGTDAEALTQQFLTSVKDGYLSPTIFSIWLSVARNPKVTAAVLRQQHSDVARRAAIKTFRRHLCSKLEFTQTWAAVGGTSGFVELIATLSVRDILYLFRELGSLYRVKSMCQERQVIFSDLIMALMPDPSAPCDEDQRPLHDVYSQIIPSCAPAMALEWGIKAMNGLWEPSSAARKRRRYRFWSRVIEVHWRDFDGVQRDRFLSSAISADGVDLSKVRPLVERSPSTGIEVLAKFNAVGVRMKIQSGNYISDVACPVAKRCMSPSVDPSLHDHAWSLIIEYLRMHDAERYNLKSPYSKKTKKTNLLYYASQPRSRSVPRPYDEEKFTAMYGYLNSRVTDIKVDIVIESLPPKMRYRYLRLLLQTLQKSRIDIGPVVSTDSSMFKDTELGLPAKVFLLLPPLEGVALFDRYLDNCQGSLTTSVRSMTWGDYYEQGKSILNQSDPMHRYPELVNLRAMLLQRASTSVVPIPSNLIAALEYVRTRELHKRKVNAMETRIPQERALWALFALHLCIALDDFTLYHETLIWARRFTRDVSVMYIYSKEALMAVEVLDMMCGLPRGVHSLAISSDCVKQRVLGANTALLTLLGTLTLALREPGFVLTNWDAIFTLIIEVVRLRLERICIGTYLTQFSDSEIFDNILQPTIDLLVAAERITMKPGHEKLELQDPRGLLRDVSLPSKLQPRKCITTFLDDLAKSRNQLWTEQRSQNEPAASKLTSPWPRGLPVQCLLPWPAQHDAIMPFVRSQACAVVFCDSDAVLAEPPDNDDIRQAISIYIDCWREALQLYIKLYDKDSTRLQRIQKAWSYALANLTSDRMSPDEAVLFWDQIFRQADIKATEMEIITGARVKQPSPHLPSSADPLYLAEWCPDHDAETFQSGLKQKCLSLTCLDCMLQIGSYYDRNHPLKDEDFVTKFATATGDAGPLKFWEYHSQEQNQSEATIDALVTAAILCINGEDGSHPSLLTQPFPTTHNYRIPAVRLSQDFSNKHRSSAKPLEYLKKYLSHVPPELLVRLAASKLQRLDSDEGENPTLFSKFVVAMKLVCSSNAPRLGCQLIADFLIGYPECSAWHQQVFNHKMLDSLSPQHVESFFTSFVETVVKRLKAQAAYRNTSEIKSRPATVKITTVKMVAQVLTAGKFVSPSFSIRVLGELLSNASHIDIRFSALNTLSEMLKLEKTSPRSKSSIFELLHAYAIPIAGSLNERRPETEADWAKAEAGGKLPDVQLSMDDRPVLGLLLNLSTSHDGISDAADKKKCRDLAHAALRKSAENNHRWMKLFMKENAIMLPPGVQLPAVPVSLQGLAQMMASDIPHDLFNCMQNYMLLMLSPPAALNAVKSSIRGFKELADSNGGKHWMTTWDLSIVKALELFIAKALAPFELKDYDDDTDEQPAIHKLSPTAPSEFYSLLLDIARLIIQAGDPRVFIKYLGCMNSKYGRAMYQNLLKNIIAMIDGTRTLQWQANENRQPPRLPDTFRLHIKLLNLRPLETKDSRMPEGFMNKYIDRVVQLMERMAKSDVPQHHRFKVLADRVILYLGDYRIPAALRLGSLENLANPNVPGQVDCLRVEMAAMILKTVADVKANEQKDSLVSQTQQMIESWGNSKVEHFRNIAYWTHANFWKRHRKQSPYRTLEVDWLHSEGPTMEFDDSLLDCTEEEYDRTLNHDARWG